MHYLNFVRGEKVTDIVNDERRTKAKKYMATFLSFDYVLLKHFWFWLDYDNHWFILIIITINDINNKALTSHKELQCSIFDCSFKLK